MFVNRKKSISSPVSLVLGQQVVPSIGITKHAIPCSICNTGDDVKSRSIDCSNIDADAVDTDCVPDTDNVDAQVLKFNSTAVCTFTTSSANGFTDAVALAASVAGGVLQFW